MKLADGYRKKEQTYLKHFLLNGYLEAVAFHIGYAYGEFVYVDCFSGPWQAADEALADTSIRIALDKLNYVHDGLAGQGRQANIRAIFIEKDRAAFRALTAALTQHSRNIKTQALPGTFESNIAKILQHVGNTFAFFFIDPKGWTGFAMENIKPILRHQPGEVMVNFMYDFINRFMNHVKPANEQSLDRLFGTTHWRDIRNVNDRETASLDLYKEQLRTNGKYTFVTSMRILKPLSDRAYFHLVYATRSPKGVIKFRDVEKKAVTEQEHVRATTQRAHREDRTGQKELSFETADNFSSSIRAERTKRLKEAETRLVNMIKEGPIAYEQLQPRILELPLVWNSDLSAMLVREQKAGRLHIDGLTSRQKTPKAGNTIRLPPGQL